MPTHLASWFLKLLFLAGDSLCRYLGPVYIEASCMCFAFEI